MSAISESATINVMLADYAAMDLTGVKANILGVGGNILPITPVLLGHPDSCAGGRMSGGDCVGDRPERQFGADI